METMSCDFIMYMVNQSYASFPVSMETGSEVRYGMETGGWYYDHTCREPDKDPMNTVFDITGLIYLLTNKCILRINRVTQRKKYLITQKHGYTHPDKDTRHSCDDHVDDFVL